MDDIAAGGGLARGCAHRGGPSRARRTPTDFALPGAAKELALSPRSLQRKLHDVGTSFQAERNLAQVRLAQKLITETDATLSQIALDVGCRSLQHFSALFRRVTGETPSQWRIRNRR